LVGKPDITVIIVGAAAACSLTSILA